MVSTDKVATPILGGRKTGGEKHVAKTNVHFADDVILDLLLPLTAKQVEGEVSWEFSIRSSEV